LARITMGQTARVRLTAVPGVTLPAKVVRSGRMLGAEDRILSVWIELEKRPQAPLLHNMLTRIAVTTGESRPTLAVPLGALVREGTHTYVFVRKPDGTFVRPHVKTGREDDRYVEIVDGLTTGQEIAVSGVAQLRTAHAGIR